ncbi:MAG: PQQ-binding-like beta-propeller repeat protein [Verrucomicrobiales bacterium]|nr:PQQ-binding-like beta-propeller repeat protein [Verrucomicrobiales bacterium]
MRTLLLTLALIPLALPARADWLNFRGPNGSGHAPDITTTVGELSDQTLAWQVALPGRGLGSPIIVGDKIIVTAASGPEQQQLHILCFSAKDGSPVWERRFWATGRTMSHSKTNVAAPTPASDGERIYALYSSNDLICVDLDGNLVWMRGLTLDYPNASNSLGMASSPIVVGDTLVAQIENDSESFAAGFDLLTGVNKWKLDRPKSANWTSPTILNKDGESIVALQSSDGILGLVPATGSSVFTVAGGASTIPSAAASGSELYIPSNGVTVVALGATGEEPKKVWNQTNQRPGTASLLVAGEKLYLINNAGVLTCAKKESGEVLWEVRLKGPFSGSPVAGGDGKLYIFSEQGVGQVVDPSGEKGVVSSEVELGETILCTPALDGKALYIRSDGHLWKFAGK